MQPQIHTIPNVRQMPYKHVIFKSVQTLLLISCLQSVASQLTRIPTPTPINQPTAMPTPVPFALCCDCIDSTPTIAGCPIDPDCEDEICIDLPSCCTIEWQSLCANTAETICFPPNNATISPTNSPLPSLPLCCACTNATNINGKRCPMDVACELLICGQDSYCCNTMWDDICASAATKVCNNATLSPTISTTSAPTTNPTHQPTLHPTIPPTYHPTIIPSQHPTKYPMIPPTMSPSVLPLCCACTEIKPGNVGCAADTECEVIVCDIESACCVTQWNVSCVTIAESVCNDSMYTLPPTIRETSSSPSPTPEPTPKPTSSPSPSPNDITTLDPTEIPSSQPTDIPTPLPTTNPTLSPFTTTNTPTSNIPTTDIPTTNTPTTYIPTTIIPTIKIHTLLPTINPIVEISTDFPTLRPVSERPTFPPSDYRTPTIACDECYKYGVELVNIEQDDDMMDIDECNDKNRKHSDKKGKKKKKNKNSRGKRKLLNTYLYGKKYADNYNKCARKNNGNGMGRNKHKGYDCESEVCLTYAVIAYDERCGALNAIFLPLCDEDWRRYNWMDMSAEYLDRNHRIITKVYPRGLTVYSAVMYDALGIMVEFDALMFVDAFTICLKGLSVDDNYYRNDFDEITVANWVVFNVEGEGERCINNDGLPCFNFMFDGNC